MKSKKEKEALALVFGVMRHDGILSGVPGFVPGLRQKLQCTTCELKLVKGLPIQFESYMTEEQKKQFKRITGYKESRRSRNKVSAVPQEVTEQVVEEPQE